MKRIFTTAVSFAPYSILFFFSLIIILHHQFAFFGYFGYDDMAYSTLSHEFAEDKSSLTSHFAYRWALIVPVGLLYKLAGISDLTTALWSIVVSSLFLCAIGLYLKKHGPIVLFFSLAVFILNPEVLLWSDKLMPDIHFSFYIICSFLALYSYYQSTRYTVVYSFLFSSFVFASFLTKELTWLLLPVYGFCFMLDVIQKKKLAFWWLSLLFISAEIFIYFFLIYVKTGDFLNRFTLILQNQYFNQCSYDLLPISETIKRITYLPFFSFIHSGFIVSITFFITTLLTLSLNPFHLKKNSETHFWARCYCLAMLSIWFTSISFQKYVPMCPDSRHFIYSIPLSLFAVAPSLSENFKKIKFLLLNLFSFAGIFLIAKSIQSQNAYYFLIIALTFGLLAVLNKKHFHALALYCLIITGYFAYEFYASWQYSLDTCYTEQKTLIETRFSQNKQQIAIITNDVQKNTGNFYLKFNTAYTHFISFSEMESYDYSQVDRIYFLSNYHTEFYSGINDDNKPYFINSPPEAFKLHYEYRSIKLYEVPSGKYLTYKKAVL